MCFGYPPTGICHSCCATYFFFQLAVLLIPARWSCALSSRSSRPAPPDLDVPRPQPEQHARTPSLSALQPSKQDPPGATAGSLRLPLLPARMQPSSLGAEVHVQCTSCRWLERSFKLLYSLFMPISLAPVSLLAALLAAQESDLRAAAAAVAVRAHDDRPLIFEPGKYHAHQSEPICVACLPSCM